MNQKSSELVKSMPHKMKKQGLRDVSITTASGEVVTVKAAYHTRKKKAGGRKKNHKRGFLSRAFPFGHL